MRKQKYYLYLTAEERRYIFNALLSYRNKLIAQGRNMDIVDEVMIQFAKLFEITTAPILKNGCTPGIIGLQTKL